MASGLGGGMVGFGGSASGIATQQAAPNATDAAFQTQHNDGWLSNKWYGTDPTAHNEAYYSWLRESASAREAREYEKMLSDTQMQRKVKDYEAAGFSPLAALENGGGNYVPATAAASSQAAGSDSGNGLGTVLGAVIGAILAIATKGASSAVASGVAKKKAAQEFAQRVLMK